MEPWTVVKKALPKCGGDTSYSLGPNPMAACPEFYIGCRLAQELFTLLVCCYQCPWSHGLRSKMLYPSVAVTPAPVRVLTQRPLVPSFTSVVG